MRANFEFLKKLGVDWWCFHDRDIAPDGNTLEVIQPSVFFSSFYYIVTLTTCNLLFLLNVVQESNKNLDEVIELAKELQKVIRVTPSVFLIDVGLNTWIKKTLKLFTFSKQKKTSLTIHLTTI